MSHIRGGTSAEGVQALGAKTEKEYEGWRKPHNEQLPCLNYLPNIVTQIKSTRIIWAEYVACMADKRNA